jgi:hypothetical protein
MSTATVELPCDRSAAHQARRWVMEQHLRWAFAGRGAFQHLFDDLVLCVSELVTTAVEAGSTTISLSLNSTPQTVRLAMIDPSPDSSLVAQLRRSSNGHRARIIDAIASRWGAEPGPTTNEIWIEFDLAGSTAGVIAGR